MLNVQRLILLRELESLGSLAAVARAKEISPAAVSQQLTKLEEEAGLALVEQVGRRLALTQLGRTLARRADEAVAVLERAQADVDAERGEVQGTVRLCAFGSFATAFFATILRRLHHSHPKVVLELSMLEPTAAVDSVLGRRADVAIVDEYSNLPQPQNASLRSVRLFRDQVLAYTPAPVETVQELGSVPWVFEPSGTTAAEWARNLCRRAGLEPVIRFESPDLRFHYDLAAAGAAAAFLPDIVFSNPVGPVPRPAYVVPWPEEISAQMHRDVYAVLRRGADLQPATKALVNHVMSLTAALP